MKTISDNLPEKFNINKMGKVAELTLNINIEEILTDDRVSFHFDSYIKILVEPTREKIISEFIRFIYPLDEEFSLINKGIENKENIDYINYNIYRNEVKLFVNNNL